MNIDALHVGFKISQPFGRIFLKQIQPRTVRLPMAILAEDKDRDALIQHFSILEGKWELTASGMSFRKDPKEEVKGTASFQRLEQHNLMVYRNEAPGSEFPAALCVIGFDETARSFTMLYTDSRNVSRIYSMTLSPRNWTLERMDAGFSQRFEGVISEDGNTIEGEWKKREGQGEWVHDINIRFARKM